MCRLDVKLRKRLEYKQIVVVGEHARKVIIINVCFTKLQVAQPLYIVRPTSKYRSKNVIESRAPKY